MRTFLLLLGLVWLAQTVDAEINAEPVLEFLADTCPYIGVYELESAALHPLDEKAFTAHQKNYPWWTRSFVEELDLKAKLKTALRGSPPDAVAFTGRAYVGLSLLSVERTIPVKFNAEDTFLVCWREREDHIVEKVNVISLTKPVSGLDLHMAFRPDYTVLTDGEIIQTIVAARIAAKPHTTRARQNVMEKDGTSAVVEIPGSAPAFNEVFSGSSCYLYVPNDLVPISKAAAEKFGDNFRLCPF